MARHEEAEPVACTERPRRSCRTRRPGECRQLAVGHDLAARDRPQLLGTALEKRRLVFEVEIDVVERVRPAAEIRPKPLDELTAGSPIRARGAREREIVLNDASALEPELPHAPALDLVGDLRHDHAHNPRIDV
jgi:hypothetical protein